jgi:outer membrane protein TolC
VLDASTRFEQARESQASWSAAVIAPLEENLEDAERSFAQGDTSYLFVLDNSRRLTEARLRGLEIDADLARGLAAIERAVGRACVTALKR